MAQRLLIVDDKAAVRFALTDYLSRYGYEPDSAASRREAEALLALASYPLVIADLCLAGSSDTEGLDIVRYVRERCPGTEVILLTGHLSPEIATAARLLGAAAALSKDMSLAAIAAVVRDLLDGGAS